jgi:hypothetical protein
VTISNRLRRLERQHDKPVGRTFDEVLITWGKSLRWLESNGYRDALAALEDGAEIPADLVDEIHEQAIWCPRHRAFAKIEAALLGVGTAATDDDWTAFHSDLDASCGHG